MSITLDTPRFLFADITTAVPDVDPLNLRAWITRGAATHGEHDRTSGKRVLLTLKTVYEFAIAANMVGVGLTPAMAFVCAREFTRGKEAGRNPDTLLFDRAQTLLLVWRGTEKIKAFDATEPYSNLIEIYNCDPKDSAELFGVLFKNNSCACTVIHVNPILEAVDRALDVRRDPKATPRPAKSARAAKVVC